MTSICTRMQAAISSGVVSGVIAVGTGTLTSAAALLGKEVLKAAGDPAGNFTFKEVIIPTLVGSTIVLGGLGFLFGGITGKQVNCGW